MAMTKSERSNLNTAIGYLNKFLDPNNPGCTVSPEVREAARLYLSTWVRGPLAEIVQEEDKGGFIHIWGFEDEFSTEVYREPK